MIYNKNNFIIKDFCSTSPTRPELTGVFFQPTESVATDTFTIIKVSSLEKNGNFKPFILDPNQAGLLAKDKNPAWSYGMPIAEIQKYPKITGEYPKYNDIFVERGKFVEIKVNAGFLEKIAKFYKNFSPKKEMIIKIPVKPDDPIRFYSKADRQEATAILMPLKSEQNDKTAE